MPVIVRRNKFDLEKKNVSASDGNRTKMVKQTKHRRFFFWNSDFPYNYHFHYYSYLIFHPPTHNYQVNMCVTLHQSVAAKSTLFLAELSRHNYVTPTSYLELLGIFSKLLTLKKMELKTAKNRTKTGLDKVGVVVWCSIMGYGWVVTDMSAK